MTTYTKTPVSEKPEKADWYFTEHEKLKPTKTIQYWDGDMWLSKEITHWLKPVPPEAISLEEAKDKIAQKYTDHRTPYGKWKTMETSLRLSLPGVLLQRLQEAAELYHNQNSAALREELEDRKEYYMEVTQNSRDEYYKALEERNQHVKTLREALKSAEIIVRDYAFQYGEQGTHIAMEVSKALSNTNQS